MLASVDGGALRKLYFAARGVPGVRRLWRSISPDDNWRDVEAYAKAQGRFAVAGPAPAGELPRFESDRYFPTLLSRICEARGTAPSIPGRIVLINNGLSAGGAERQIVCTLNGLAAAGYDARFVGEHLGRAPGHDFHAPALLAASVPAIPLKRRTGPGPTTYESVSIGVAEILAEAPPDLMIDILDMTATLKELRPSVAHIWQDDASTKYGVAALIAGVPSIVLSGRNVNPTHFAYHRPHMRSAYRMLATAPGVRLTNNSEAGARSYADWLGLPREAFQVIHNGFDPGLRPTTTAAERQALRARLGAGDGAPLVVGVFRLAAEKRPLLWIEAAAAALAIEPTLKFAIAGDGPLASQARAAAAGLPIDFLGEIRSVMTLLSAADLFFLSSSEEGLPNVLIEAQAAGALCLATPAGGVVEAADIGGGAEIVADADPKALGAAVARLAFDAARSEKARRSGPRFVDERFGMDRMIAETVSVYGLGRAPDSRR